MAVEDAPQEGPPANGDDPRARRTRRAEAPRAGRPGNKAAPRGRPLRREEPRRARPAAREEPPPAQRRRSAGAPRARLLAAVLDYVAAQGVSDFSLREVAAAIGTSHRMLIYHFGSREGLLVAVVRAVEAAQRALLAELAADPALSPAEVMRRMWARLADPVLWPNERLFFELYGQALQGRPGTAGLLDDIVEAWVEPAAAYGVQRGLPPETARADARLGVAVVRGLLLDLLATGDRGAVDEALERFISQYEALAPPPADGAPGDPRRA